MPEIDEISARLTALETVVSQLITHLAVRADDPARWVETRKVLALNGITARQTPSETTAARMYDAVAGIFDQAQHVASEYSFSRKTGTRRAFAR